WPLYSLALLRLRYVGRIGERLRPAPFHGHVARREEAEDAVARLDLVQLGLLRDHLISGTCGRLTDRRASVDRLLETRAAAAHQDVDPMIDELLGNRSGTARAPAILRTAFHVGRTLTRSRCHVRAEHRGRRVGQLRRRDVA